MEHRAGAAQRASVPAGPSVRGHALTPRATLLSLGVLYAGLQAYLWLVVPSRRPILIALGALVLAVVAVADARRRGETPESLGLTLTSFSAALRLVAVPTLAIVVALLALNVLVPDAPRGRSFVRRVVDVLPWVAVQQGLLQTLYNRRLTLALGPGWRSAAINGVLFGGMHLPGPALLLATAVAGAWWSRIYQRHPNVWALVLSHAVLSAAAQSLLPGAWFHGFRVGPGYFRWR